MLNIDNKNYESPIERGLMEYDEFEINNYFGSKKIEIAQNREHIRDFINKAIAGDNLGKKLLLGKIGNDLSRRIYQMTGIDLAGYNLELRTNEIRHSRNHHCNEKTESLRGQQVITAEDFANFPKIVANFDKVLVRRNNCLHFIKDIGGKITAVTVYASGNKSLSLKTMYKGNIKWEL